METKKRAKRHNNPVESFWAKLQKTETCWLWTANTLQNGYGTLSVFKKFTYAHRYSWELHNGPIPDGVFVCHHCDVPACVNPEHLFLGFQKQNIEDMHAKRRGPVGERHGNHKLTLPEVQEILNKLGKQTQSEIAKEYGVSRTAISAISTGRNWTRAFKENTLGHLDDCVGIRT